MVIRLDIREKVKGKALQRLPHCEKKIRYAKKREATQAAREQYKKKRRRLYPYFCNVCQGWHLTSTKQGQRNDH